MHVDVVAVESIELIGDSKIQKGTLPDCCMFVVQAKLI